MDVTLGQVGHLLFIYSLNEVTSRYGTALGQVLSCHAWKTTTRLRTKRGSLCCRCSCMAAAASGDSTASPMSTSSK